MKTVLVALVMTASLSAMAKTPKRTPASSKTVQIHGTIKQSGNELTFLEDNGSENVIAAKASLMMELKNRVGEANVCLEIAPSRDETGGSGEDHVVGWCAK